MLSIVPEDNRQNEATMEELIAIAVMRSNIRCFRLPDREKVVFRPKGGTYEIVEGEILKVNPVKEWRYKMATYISGEIDASYIDGRVLSPVPLNLYRRGMWDPLDEIVFMEEMEGDHTLPPTLRGWIDAVISAGKRPVYEMEQIIPGMDPEDPDDPITIAAGYGRIKNFDAAFDILWDCLEGDLRCIDAYAHIALYYMGDARSEQRVQQARRCYQAGVEVGEQALPLNFNGLLPWSWIDNRPFLRALHGLGLCRWRLGDFAAAAEIFRRIFMLDPEDSLGVAVLPILWKSVKIISMNTLNMLLKALGCLFHPLPLNQIGSESYL